MDESSKHKERLYPETLQEFCGRWKVPISWGYQHTRMKGPDRLPHIKAGKYIRVLPEEGDRWMAARSKKI